MPIVITEPVPGSPFGVGHLVTINTDTIGPFLGDCTWNITLSDADELHSFANFSIAVEDPHVITSFRFEAQPFPNNFVRQGANQGDTMTLRARLLVNGTPTEQLPISVKQDLLAWPFVNATTTEGGALTPVQAQQLQEVHEQTFLSMAIDALLLSEITSGPQGGVVTANLAFWIFGVIVRIATVPPEFRVNTADGDYWVRSLAVVRIYRGSDLWKRVPVHTSSKMISFVEEGLVVAVSSLTMTQWLTQISIQVSFAEGVTGQVFLMRAP